jgi:SpoVK/Ycf46/Vps4 family AAA+-type ATPase
MSEDFFERVGQDAYANGPGGLQTQKLNQRTAQAQYAVEAPTPSAPKAISLTGDRRWAASHDTFWGATQTYDELPPGLYRCDMAPQIGPILIKQAVSTDNLLELPDDATTSIIAEFEAFWRLEPEFRARGFMHKRGFMLWGPPGSGKTSCVQLLVKRLIDDIGGVVLFIDHPEYGAQCLSMARKIEPKRPMIAIMEDIDALINRHGENEYLALLDGEAQVDNIVFLATTNYPERLDKRFVDRPSRFDTIRYVGMPTADARRVYFKAKEPSVTDDELEQWVAATDGLSVAHLKELIIAVRCFQQPLEEVAERLEKMHARKPSSEESPDAAVVGFTPRMGTRIGGRK